MTLDFMLGFASPTAAVVRQSPQGLRGWFIFWMARRMVAKDGYILTAALRLLGVTIGGTFCVECKTPLTNAPESGVNTPGPSAPQSPQPQLSAEQLATLKAMAIAQVAQQKATRSASRSSGPTRTTGSRGR